MVARASASSAGSGGGTFEPAGEPRQRQPLDEQRAGHDGEGDQQQDLAVRGALGDDEGRGQRDHAAHPGPAQDERVGPRRTVPAGPRPRPDQQVARGEHPRQPQHDHGHQGGRAHQRDPARREVAVAHVGDDPVGLQADQEEDRVLEDVGDGAPVHPLGDPRLRGLDDRGLVAQEQAGDDDRDHARAVDRLGLREEVRRERDDQGHAGVEQRVGRCAGAPRPRPGTPGRRRAARPRRRARSRR